MLFVMPSHFTADSVPVPTDPTVSVRTIPAAVYAVRTFGGWASEAEMTAQASELEAALEHSLAPPRRGLGDGLPLRLKVLRDSQGRAVWMQARYDSPWVPPERRTNEVLMQVIVEEDGRDDHGNTARL